MAWALAMVFVIIQFFQPKRNKSGELLPADITVVRIVPDSVQAILKTSCFDCHSNNTVYPWYANIQPIGWLVAKDIRKGKAELNFSDFGSYSLRKQQSKLRSMENRIRDESMPMHSYTLIHKDAVLSDSRKEIIYAWVSDMNIKNDYSKKY